MTPSTSSKGKKKGKKKEPPTKKPKTSKNDKDAGAYVTAEVLNARLLDLMDTLLGAFKEAKEDPPKPSAASESDKDSSEGESSEEADDAVSCLGEEAVQQAPAEEAKVAECRAREGRLYRRRRSRRHERRSTVPGGGGATQARGG
jgi:hypothetical protein